jgi:hypothetical protein
MGFGGEDNNKIKTRSPQSMHEGARRKIIKTLRIPVLKIELDFHPLG